MKTSHQRLRQLGVALSCVCLLCLLFYVVSTTYYGYWPAGGPHHVVRNMSVVAAIGAFGMLLLSRYYNRETQGSPTSR